MRRIAIAAIVLALGGGSALTTLIATTNAKTPSTGLKPRLVIDRTIGFEIPNVTWRVYGTREALPAASADRCIEAVKLNRQFELIHEQELERAGELIALKKGLGLVCVAAEFEAPDNADVDQKKYWSGLFDFTVLDDQIVERDFKARFYETPVKWGQKYGENIGANAPYRVASVVTDIDSKPLINLAASKDGVTLLLPELHCFSAQAKYRFKQSKNQHLGVQTAQTKLPGGRNTGCPDSDAEATLDFSLGRVDLATFAHEKLNTSPGQSYFPTAVTYYLYKINKAIEAARSVPLKITSETGEKIEVLLEDGSYEVAAHFQPSREANVSPEFIEVVSPNKIEITKGEISSDKGRDVILNVGGVTLEWQSATAQEVVYNFYRDEQFFFRGAPAQPPFLRVATRKKKIDVILPEGKFRVFASTGAGDSGTVHATVQVEKGKLKPTAPTSFKVGVARVKFRLTGVSGEAKLIPSVWEIFSDDFSHGITLTNAQAVRGIRMAPGTYNVEVPWRNRLFKTRFHISADRPQDKLIEVINWDR